MTEEQQPKSSVDADVRKHGGALGGAVAGAIAGSFIPVIGTIGGGVIGAVVGHYADRKREAAHNKGMSWPW